MSYISRFFFKIFDQIRKFYLRSNFYDKRISKIDDNQFVYRPSPHLLSSLIKYQKKKFFARFAGQKCANMQEICNFPQKRQI